MTMKSGLTPYILALVVSLLIPSLLSAQPGEAVVRVAPALVGSNGRVLVGTQAGKIFRAVDGPNNTLTIDTASAGLDLPDSITAVWTLSLPDQVNEPDRIVGLVSYRVDSATVRYGIIRSSDFGGTWELLKPAALDNAIFTPTNVWINQPLGEFNWLDGMRGWLWGRYGIVRTVDGGATWEQMRADATPTSAIWALDFKSATEGAGVMGIRAEMAYYTTVDAGRTWTKSTKSTLLPKRIIRLDYVGGEYRAFAFDRNALNLNTFMYFSQDGMEYPAFPSSRKVSIVREQTHQSELLWADSATGFMVLRSGDIFRTNDAGRTWANIQPADSAAYPIVLNNQTGFGQRSILLDNNAIVHVSTLTATGTIYKLLKWPVALSSAPLEPRERATAAMSVMPNPASGSTSIEVELKRPSALTFRVVDMLGREHLRHDLPMTGSGTLRFDLDLAGIPAGAYRCVIDGENLHADRPLVIVK
jgi:hypothetical protein